MIILKYDATVSGQRVIEVKVRGWVTESVRGDKLKSSKCLGILIWVENKRCL